MKNIIDEGKIYMGIEFGSTRIKAVLTDDKGGILATGGVNWENQLLDGVWTYSVDSIHNGLRDCYSELSKAVKENYGTVIKNVKAIGISGMMHGYLAIDKNKEILAPFRTWRNNITKTESEFLTGLFDFNIPQRWSIAHLYQAILNKESHLDKIDYLTTLAGYIHYMLTDQKMVGICEASGIFPVDYKTKNYDSQMVAKFNDVIHKNGYSFSLEDILPEVLCAGEQAGKLTQSGAAFIDPSGNLMPGALLCPPEGDAGTGMVSTNSVRQKTGNISAGTSAFAMVVLEKPLGSVHEEIDVIQTPDGSISAMVHSNNCTTELNSWMNLFDEVLSTFGNNVNTGELFDTLFKKSLSGEADCGGLVAYCFHSGEHILNLSKGCPLFLHDPDAKFNLANFVKCQLYTAFAVLKKGIDILKISESVSLDKITAHGGLFKTKGVVQDILASALDTPVVVNNAASEGGAWGIALLACYLEKAGEMSLADFLDNIIFAKSDSFEMTLSEPDNEIRLGFEKFIKQYDKYLETEYTAVRS